MGWGSASSIFNPIARQLLHTTATAKEIEDVLVLMIETFQAEDWDTEDESLQEFLGSPIVVRAFARCGVTWTFDE